MKLELTRPIVWYDIESTGVDPARDRIVQLAAIKYFPNSGESSHIDYRINPTIPIPPAATEIHGITDDMVKLCPTFLELGQILFEFFADCDLAGFNLIRFDVPMLAEEFLRCNLEFPAKDTRYIDSMVIYHEREPRDLTAALKFYCNKELIDSHDAFKDVAATKDVLEGQFEKYPDLPVEVDALHNISMRGKEIVDFAGKLAKNENGVICYNFGKAKGTPVIQDRGFGDWMLRNSFTLNTKNILQKILYPNGIAAIGNDNSNSNEIKF